MASSPSSRTSSSARRAGPVVSCSWKGLPGSERLDCWRLLLRWLSARGCGRCEHVAGNLSGRFRSGSLRSCSCRRCPPLRLTREGGCCRARRHSRPRSSTLTYELTRERLGTQEALYARLYGLYWVYAGLSARQPIMLAVDDAHWGDDASLQWLLFMARRARRSTGNARRERASR